MIGLCMEGNQTKVEAVLAQAAVTAAEAWSLQLGLVTIHMV